MPRLSKKAKQEWDFFINPKTGKRTYSDLCHKCSNECKQRYKNKHFIYSMYCVTTGERVLQNHPQSND